jgi:CheY-like chemotaxis protein
MEAVGRVAGGVAHGFNNLLSVVMGHSELLLTALDADDPLRENAEEIRSASQRAADLTRQLLALGRRQLLHPRIVDPNAMVSRVAGRLRALVPENIGVSTRLAPDVGRVEADPAHLEQAIVNLALNARDAMPAGGQLVLETRDAVLDEALAEREPGAPAGRVVSVTVRDTGCGIDASVRPHLFEPFFTTKGRSLGAGLGLATVHGIVAQHGGHVEVLSEPGRGSTFTVYLPRVDGPAPADDDGPPGQGAWRGAETVLVVEDDPRVRGLVRTMLARSGYAVLVAAGGAEALEVARRHDHPIHVLLTDVVMPEMSGRELAERLVVTRPGLRVVYVSGYTNDVIARDDLRDPGTVFLEKPFTEEGLGRTIRRVLDGPAGVASPFPAAPVTEPARPSGEAPPASTPLVVVQRGRLRLFEALRVELESRARVMWDRRVEERRRERSGIPAERRRNERRQAAPSGWPSVGFLLVS